MFIYFFFFYRQGNIRVFCRVRPLVDGCFSKHIQLPASDNKMITLAKTEEVQKLGAYWGPQSLKEKEGAVFITANEMTNLVFFSLTQAKPLILRRIITSALTVCLVPPLHNRRCEQLPNFNFSIDTICYQKMKFDHYDCRSLRRSPCWCSLLWMATMSAALHMAKLEVERRTQWRGTSLRKPEV